MYLVLIHIWGTQNIDHILIVSRERIAAAKVQILKVWLHILISERHRGDRDGKVLESTGRVRESLAEFFMAGHGTIPTKV